MYDVFNNVSLGEWDVNALEYAEDQALLEEDVSQA